MGRVTEWTRVTDPAAAASMPAWFASPMMGAARQQGGSFGLLLTTGDVLRVASLAAIHLSPRGTVLLDVVLDHAGVPEGVDTAWRSKHFLGAPLPSMTMATVNLAQVVAAVAFADGKAAVTTAEASAAVEELRQAAEDAAERHAQR